MSIKTWRALIVEDDASVRGLLARCVERAGWQALAVASADEAFHAFASGRFRAVLSDVDLPEGRDGVQLARTLRDVQPGLFFLLLSGDPSNEERARAAGFESFMHKPFDTAGLVGWLRSLRPPRRVSRLNSVLVLEDDPAVREFLVHYIDSAGWAVESARNGAEAFRAFERRKFGWLVADVVLGDELDGIDVARTLLLKEPGLKVAMISGVPGVAERVEAAKVGPFFPKPVGMGALADLLGLDAARS
ncbi:MAG TPA: hypothetical protein DCM05_06030 [Elusimicrobia bacterium]|nr:hypothetical protein [Elusimicrobiota bacterium]